MCANFVAMIFGVFSIFEKIFSFILSDLRTNFDTATITNIFPINSQKKPYMAKGGGLTPPPMQLAGPRFWDIQLAETPPEGQKNYLGPPLCFFRSPAEKIEKNQRGDPLDFFGNFFEKFLKKSIGSPLWFFQNFPAAGRKNIRGDPLEKFG